MIDRDRIIEQRGPFQVLDRLVRHRRFGMEFLRDRIKRPDGTLGLQYWLNFLNEAVMAFPVDEEGKVHLMEEFTYGTNKFSLESSGGSIRRGETIGDAAQRIVAGEIGIELASPIIDLGRVDEISSRVNNHTNLALARVRTIGNIPPEQLATIRRRPVPYQEAHQMAMDGRITNAVTAVGILRMAPHLQEYMHRS